MPQKSKRKKMRVSSSNPIKITAKPAGTVTTQGEAPVANKPSMASRNSPSGSRAATAQYTPGQFKYVGTELRVAGLLSIVILAVIITLYFILR